MTDNKKWFTLAAACLALFMAILDNLVVNVALPTISRDLQASTTQLQWIVSAYTLVFASIQITAGGLGDRLGRKRWFLGGLALFTSASLFGAFAQNVGMLIAARALQGLGAAFIMPLTLSLISVAFPPEERGKAIGIWSAISVSGLAFGPIIGGALVQYASWHWVFLINVPIGILTFIFSLVYVRESRDESGDVAFDLPGTVLITGAVASLTWALIEAGDRGWGDALILTAFAVAVVLLGSFIAVESRVARPMVPLGFFRSSTFTGANIDAFAISFAIGGVAFFLTLYQQNVHGFSPVRSGLSLLPLVLVMMAGAPLSGVLVSRIGARRLISIGMIISGVGTLLFLRAAPDAPYVDLLPAFLVLGAGNSLIFSPMTTAVLNSVESHRSGVASAVNGAVREIGTAFSIALLGTLANRVYRADFNADPEIIAARANPAFPPPVQGVIDFIGGGASFGGRVIEDPNRFPDLPESLVAQLRDVSSLAFVDGMHAAIVVSSIGMFAVSVVSFLLIRDSATITRPVPVAGAAPEGELTLATPNLAVAPAMSAAASPNGQEPDGIPEPAYIVLPALATTGNGEGDYHSPRNAGDSNGDVREDRSANGHIPDEQRETGNGYAPDGTGNGGEPYVPYTVAPYTVAPLPASQWGSAYEEAALADANGYPAFNPAFGSAPSAFAPAAYGNDRWYVPQYAPPPPFSAPIYPPGAAWVPEHLTSAMPQSSPFEPVVEFDQPYGTQAYPVMPPMPGTPPGMTWGPENLSPSAAMAMMHDQGWDSTFEDRIAALERFAQESVPQNPARDDEVDVLIRKVGALEEMMLRFANELPIRIGDEIGGLERRVAYLSDELSTRVQEESDSVREKMERLDRKVGMLDRFAQTIPPARWHHDHDTRSEILERRVVELERFCTALARRGTAPREIAATTGAITRANGKANDISSSTTRATAAPTSADLVVESPGGERRGRR